jgi:hypothetical protein
MKPTITSTERMLIWFIAEKPSSAPEKRVSSFIASKPASRRGRQPGGNADRGK